MKVPVDLPAHGGQPERIRELYELDCDLPLLDFSANLNPLGPPDGIGDTFRQVLPELYRYPDPEYTAARQAIAAKEGVSSEQVCFTNGGAEAIYLVARLLQQSRAVILQPTFSEYEQACAHYGVRTKDVLCEPPGFGFPVQQVLQELDKQECPAGIFLCRPNNPTGTLAPEDDIRQVLEAAERRGTLVIIDEAFIDFVDSPGAALTRLLSYYPNLVLLRSMTKMFTVPGLRIGYMLADPDVIRAVRKSQMPWSANGLAAGMVPFLLQEEAFVQRTRRWLREQLSWLRRELSALRFDMSDTCVNFYLLHDQEHPDGAQRLYTFLLRQGIVARHTNNFKQLGNRYVRLAVRSAEEHQRLLGALGKWRHTV